MSKSELEPLIEGGLFWCNEKCKQCESVVIWQDGPTRICKITGFRNMLLCIPAVGEMVAELERLRNIIKQFKDILGINKNKVQRSRKK